MSSFSSPKKHLAGGFGWMINDGMAGHGLSLGEFALAILVVSLAKHDTR
jgi:hypothetical protein